MSFSPDPALAADRRLFAHDVIYFNPARLDRSFALSTEAYAALATPRCEPIAEDGSTA